MYHTALGLLQAIGMLCAFGAAVCMMDCLNRRKLGAEPFFCTMMLSGGLVYVAHGPFANITDPPLQEFALIGGLAFLGAIGLGTLQSFTLRRHHHAIMEYWRQNALTIHRN